MLSASRYLLAGSPHNCAFCREPLTTKAHRRSNDYFCNELCADAAPQVDARISSAMDDTSRPMLRIAA